MIDGKLLIEELIEYGILFLSLDKRDKTYTRNLLLKEFNLDAPLNKEVDFSYIKNYDVPDELVYKIEKYARENNLVNDGEENIFSTRIFGLISPLPSKVNDDFNRIKREEGCIKACEYFYNLSIKNNYIQKTAISKNLFWKYADGNKYLEITINLSKPEKDNKDIAKLLVQKDSDAKYPQCLLCKENEGYMGRLSHPSRVNLRTISLTLGNEPWFIQYSPYAYFNEHLIAISNNHTPMHICEDTIEKELDFVDYLPNYMIGSNASLPIVGGSILNHEHFQGGEHLMPMHYAKIISEYKSKKYSKVKCGVVDWYNSVVRLESADRTQIKGLAKDIVIGWEKYTSEENYIFAETKGEKHNSLSPITRKIGKKYIIDLILRNNITNKEYPDGVFHAHPEYHNIKKEGIGLIEAMGLFILPGRLKKQLNMIAEILCKKDDHKIDLENGYLSIHKQMIESLIIEGYSDSMEKAEERVIDKVNSICKNILINTAVFKNDEIGRKGFDKFLNTVGLFRK